jgi:DNA modification methylase
MMSSAVAVATVEHLPIADDSVDLIFTDPPYERAQLNTYVWLAQEAMRVHKPGGFLLAMCGGSYLNQIFRIFDDAGLVYYWEHRIWLIGQRPGIVWRGGHHGRRL